MFFVNKRGFLASLWDGWRQFCPEMSSSHVISGNFHFKQHKNEVHVLNKAFILYTSSCNFCQYYNGYIPGVLGRYKTHIFSAILWLGNKSETLRIFDSLRSGSLVGNSAAKTLASKASRARLRAPAPAPDRARLASLSLADFLAALFPPKEPDLRLIFEDFRKCYLFPRLGKTTYSKAVPIYNLNIKLSSSMFFT